jgi:hypothetical protein
VLGGQVLPNSQQYLTALSILSAHTIASRMPNRHRQIITLFFITFLIFLANTPKPGTPKCTITVRICPIPYHSERQTLAAASWPHKIAKFPRRLPAIEWVTIENLGNNCRSRRPQCRAI